MRIISGKLKGMILKPLVGFGIRPSSDRLRETLFNILGQSMEDEFVLDGFAGTGTLGIEAYSRGAEFICMVDQSSTSISIIEKNLSHAKIPIADYRIVHQNFYQFLSGCSDRFNTIFLDPPYQEYQTMPISQTVHSCRKILLSAGRIVFEHSSKLEFNWFQFLPDWRIYQRQSGQSMITILQSEN